MPRIQSRYLLLAVFVLGACAGPLTTAPPTPTVVPSHTPSPTSTAPPTATFTAVPTNTALPPTATETNTPRPTRTATATDVPPTATNTRVPVTLTPLPPTATFTAVPPAIPHFPETVFYPFTPDDFISVVKELQVNTQTFQMYFSVVVSSGSTGNCGAPMRSRGHWRSALGFADVPPEWLPTYALYRVTVVNLLAGTEPIGILCTTGGGTLSEGDDRRIIDAVEAGQSALNQVLIQANALK